MPENEKSQKLSDDSTIPELEGWVNITEAGDILGISRQHSYRLASKHGKPGGYETLHRIGKQPTFVIRVEELEKLRAARDEKAAAKAAKSEEE